LSSRRSAISLNMFATCWFFMREILIKQGMRVHEE
jgi:hypothetical protein